MSNVTYYIHVDVNQLIQNTGKKKDKLAHLRKL
jgi:hypothetical protein